MQTDYKTTAFKQHYIFSYYYTKNKTINLNITSDISDYILNNICAKKSDKTL